MSGSKVPGTRQWLLAATLASACFTAASAAPVERQQSLDYTPIAQEIQTSQSSLVDFTSFVEGVSREGAPELFIVRLPELPLAMYAGEIAGLAAPGRSASGRLDVNSASARAYVEFLQDRQQSVLSDASRLLGREVGILFTFQHAFNGMAIEASATEVLRLLEAGLIEHAEPYAEYPLLTDAGPEWIGSPNVWSGAAIGGAGTSGEGVVVGIIDSGINLGHPSFAAVAEDGFVHTNPLGSGNFIGWCNPGVGEVTDTCNDKLIGTWEFLGGLGLDGLYIPGGEDENGHGTHVAGTVAGNPTVSNFGGGANPPVSGVAPRANIIAYDACYTNEQGQGLCPNVSTLASINQVVADGIVDVINYSIGGGTQPWEQAISLAFLAAVDAGVFVSASAGNSGPGPNTMGHLQPWVASVAAASHDRYFAGASVTVTTAGAPAPLQGIGAVPSQGPAPAGNEAPLGVDPNNLLGCDPFGPDFFDGQIAYVERGVCGFSVKINNAANAGAVGVVVGNSNATAPIVMGATETTTIPAVMITRAAGDQLLAFAGQSGPISVRLDTEQPSAVVRDPSIGDIITGFSSRGPNPFNVTKPSVTAPGSQILAAVEAGGGEGAPEFGLKSGTSMSSPHNAGAAALLRALNPTWLPSEIQSALMLTARTGILADNGGPIEPATIFDEGAGSIRVDRAAATPLVMRETTLNFFLANPAEGGDPRTLNLAGLSDNECVISCSFQRTFRSVADGPRSFQVSLAADNDLTATISPSTFTILPGQIQTLDIEIFAGQGTDDWKFGQVVLTPVDNFDDIFSDRFEQTDSTPVFGEEPLSLPVSVVAVGAVIDVLDAEISASAGALATATETLAIGNLGGADLNWQANPTPFAPGAEILRQGGTLGNGIVSGFFTTNPANTGAYSAEVFNLSQQTILGELFFEGFVSGGIPLATNTNAVRFYIYADDNGAPAGNPEDGLDNELWSTIVANPSPGLDLSNSDVRLDLIAAGLDLPVLAAGTYWISAAPEFPTTNPRWNWLNASTGPQIAPARIITPGAAFGNGFPTWTDLGAVSPALRQLSFALSEAVSCGAPWLSVTPAAGTVVAGAAPSVVELEFDSTGLAAGTYTTNLCLGSNDLGNPFVVIPVSFEVTSDVTNLQVAHLAPFNADLAETAVDVRINGDVVLQAVEYGQSTGSLELAPGTYDIAIALAGTSTVVLEALGVILDENVKYTAIASGDSDNQALALDLLVDDLTPPAAGSFKLRLGHLAPFADGSASAEVRLADGTLVEAVDYRDFSGFIELPEGSYDLIITAPGGTPTLIDPIELSFSAGDIISAFAVGDGVNQDLGVFALPPSAPGFFVDLRDPEARVQVAHLAPFASDLEDTEVDIAVNGEVVLTNVPYGASTAYLTLPAGETTIDVRAPETETVLITATVTLLDRTDYTVLAIGNGDEQALSLLALVDDNSEPDAGEFRLRLGHAAPFASGTASAEVRLASGGLLASVDFGDTGIFELAEGNYDLVITAPGGEPVLIDPVELGFAEGAILSAFAVGDGSNQDLGIFALPSDAPGFFVDLRDPEARVQVAHLAPFASDLEDTEVDIAVNGEVVLTNVQYGASTAYLTLPAGETTIDVRAPETETVLITATVTLLDRTDYTVLAIGNGDEQALSLLALVDDNSEPDAGEFRLRLGHAAPFASGAASAEVRLASGGLLASVDFGDTGIFELAEGNYDLVITAPGGEPVLIDPVELGFAEGAILSAFAVGDGINQDLGIFALPSDAPGFFVDLKPE